VFEKPAGTQFPIHELLKRRWSTRAFSNQPLEVGALRSVFEAARWAPSSGNGQPWSFIVARREQAAEFEKLASVLNPGNAWARQAGVLALSVAALDRGPGKPNRHAWHDVGLASENLALQAYSMGLAVHMMAGFDVAMAREIFAIPERWDPVAMIALGHPGDPHDLPEEIQRKDLTPRQRRPIAEFVYTGKWGEPGGLD
jgi:nitroreductase